MTAPDPQPRTPDAGAAVDEAITCPECSAPLVRDHNSEWCDACQRLWPIGYLEGQR